MTLNLSSFFSTADRSCAQKSECSVASTKISMDDDEDDFQDANYAPESSTPLSSMADAFEELCAVVKANGLAYDLDLKQFCDASSFVSVLFGCLGVAFKFAELEYCSKVSDLAEASESFGTLRNMIDLDVQNDTVKAPRSLTRKLRRVRQGLDLIRALFQNFLSSDDCCLREAASAAYANTCAEYHTWAVRTAVYAGMYALPTRDQLLLKLNETDDSAEREMRRYINNSLPVIDYIDRLFASKDISLDW